MYNISKFKKNRLINFAVNTLAFSKIRFSEGNIELILACLVGIGAGLASVFFRYLLHQMHYFFFEIVYPWLASTSIFLLPLIPMIGAVILIPFSLRYRGEINGYGMPRFLIAVHLHGGLIKTRQIFIKIFTAALTISTGGSAGVEGPIAQIGGAVGSSIGRFFEMGSHRLKVLIACGSAAGIAAQFNAPLAGVLFAQEIVMVGEFQLQTFGVIVIASGLATAISRAYYSSAPTFGVLQYDFISYYEFAFYIVLGLLIGVLAYLFIRIFFFTGDRFAQLKIHAQLKPILGAFLVGVLGLVHFGVLGDGYSFINAAIQSPASISIGAIALLVILKMVATSITLGSGNVGGVFAPALFIGAMIGAVFGWGLDLLFPQIGIQPGSYALVGMGAFLAAATHAPMTAIFLLFELTSNYQVIIPIMFASVIGVMVARRLCDDSLDSMDLSRQGIYLHKGTEANILNSILVTTVMVREFEKLQETMSFAEFLRYFPSSKAQYYPVIDADNNLTGVVSFQDIREIMLEEGLEHLVVMKDLAQTDVITLFPGDNLTEAIRKLGIKDIAAIPVVSPENPRKILGILKRKDVIDVYNKAVLMRDIELQH
ncbi:MAG: chloride channel protein [Deltaproteobacteria bacterium]|jgi:chloride channel protein, CIC family|nr:chloride channel protein [Deltaproteobacteria bacterium]MBT4264121.1 chloride channel protein [Deltaproteobacteria bacterium]MBT4640788.1 chloride channel protein [Deltaproteobacteria bacterium]MBT6501335.1 chloride channel protein [Deltaproteobacteria bacterium]MBT6612528.1 chloride channel protein [Deltaproteobacteria bacterium]